MESQKRTVFFNALIFNGLSGESIRMKNDFLKCRTICKPGSVIDSHLSRRIVAGALQPPRERTGRPIAPIPVLLRIEFTASDTLEPTGALLPHLSILT